MVVVVATVVDVLSEVATITVKAVDLMVDVVGATVKAANFLVMVVTEGSAAVVGGDVA